jgi:serine/threonine protein kinase
MKEAVRAHSNPANDTAPTSNEVVYDNDSARLSRRTLADGRKLIVKQAKSMQAIQRLAHELGILKRLADIPGLTQLAPVDFEPNTIIFADSGGTALTHFLRGGAFSMAQWVELAAALARTLAGVHRAGVIHNDICPDKILIDVTDRQPTLIDFNIAGLLAERDVADVLAGTLPYTSPEQTGRSGRTPDQRSDLYSLGVTLYEVATRCRPFTSAISPSSSAWRAKPRRASASCS